MEEFDTPSVAIVARTLVDPLDPDVLSAVASGQDQLKLTAVAGEPSRVADVRHGEPGPHAKGTPRAGL